MTGLKHVLRRWPARHSIFLTAGILAGVAVWWIGPRAALAAAIGLVIAGGLTGWERTRVHLRRLGRENRQLRATVVNNKKVEALEKRLQAARRKDFVQLEALLNLHALLPVKHRMPPSRVHWAAAPDLLLLLVSLVQQRRPAVVVDLGSGASTAWMSLALRDFGIDGKVISVDHDEHYADVTRERLRGLGLEKFAEVRHAPLVDFELRGEVYGWYDRAAFADVKSCDLLVVDGPPGRLRRGARYPALPAFADRMSEESHIVVDDYARPAELEVVSRWVAEFPGWTLHELPFEKGAAHLVRET